MSYDYDPADSYQVDDGSTKCCAWYPDEDYAQFFVCNSDAAYVGYNMAAASCEVSTNLVFKYLNGSSFDAVCTAYNASSNLHFVGDESGCASYAQSQGMNYVFSVEENMGVRIAALFSGVGVALIALIAGIAVGCRNAIRKAKIVKAILPHKSSKREREAVERACANTLQSQLNSDKVNHLSALSESWRAALIPKQDPCLNSSCTWNATHVSRRCLAS